MFCAISGEVPTEPVASKKTGHVYEKRLIERHLLEDPRCPVTGVDMSAADLMELQVHRSVRPRPVTATSIPGMISMFQNEWDELMLETYTLRQHLDATRQELSQALYQHDASCRVIATLMRERDEARAALLHAGSTAAASNGSQAASSKMEVDNETANGASSASKIGEAVLSEMLEKYQEMSTSRKGRKASEGLCSKVDVAGFSQLSNYSLHKSDKPGVSALDVSASEASTFLLSGGVDKQLIIANAADGKVITKIANAHSKRITDVKFTSSYASDKTIFSSASDCTVKVWRETSEATGRSQAKYSEVASFSVRSPSDDQFSVSSISVHPLGSYAVAFATDGKWSFLDVARQAICCSVGSESDADANGYTAGSFHPDGLLIGGGTTSGVVQIWDVREQSKIGDCDYRNDSTLSKGGAITGISFSENGYILAAGYASGGLRLWDLRKLKCSKSLDFQEEVTAVSFDYSGVYLAVASGNSVSTMVVKEWPEKCLTLPEAHSKSITAVRWGFDARQLLTASMDRTVRVFGKQ